MKSKFSKVITTATLLGGLVSPALASEVQLMHDKGFWSEALQQTGDVAGEKAGVKIVENAYAQPEQYKAFIQSSVAGGDAPDMFTWWTGGIYEDLVSSGAVADLGDVWQGMIDRGDFPESLKDFYSIDGVAYGVPLHLSRWVALYNKAHFAEAGIEEPTTWDELMDAAEKLKAAGMTPFNATTQDGWRGFIWFQEIMIRTNPEAYAGLHDGSVPYDSEAVQAAFQLWSDWYAKGYFTDPRSNEEVPDFARGKGSIYLIGDWAIGLVEEAGMTAGEDFGAFIMPNRDAELAPAAILEGSPIVLSKQGMENPDVVKALEFFVSVDGANAWADASGNSIGNMKANPPNALVAKINEDVAANDVQAIGRWWEAVPSDLQGELVAEMNRFMLDPTMETAKSAMANMQALNEEYWSEQ